jgi:crotonobetainyl-CoA:carnitine CoA-transferase CaiB-like acyl-CoA transferase
MAKKVFEGLKVLDFTTSGTGPMSLQYLSRFGATAIRVETSHRLDTTRTNRPFKDNFSHPDYAPWPELYNAGKLAITLNLKKPKWLEIAWKLVDWCDVMGESFTPGVMAKWGLDYEGVRKVKPDIIYLSLNAQGQKGPHADWRGWGTIISGLTGHYHFTGWPDREPSGIWGAYNDFIAPRFGGLALMAALSYKKRTGKGQYIDASQFEAGALFLSPPIMDYCVNRRIQTRNGNRVPYAAPHGAYRCKGSERWIVIAVTNDERWEAFKGVLGEPEWSKDPKFSTLITRKENEDELDKLIGEWMEDKVAEDVMESMQQAGIPAGVVWNPVDLLSDPQLKHRGHYVVVEGHPIIGPLTHDASQIHLSKTPPEVGRFYGPMGHDNEYVYSEVLGMSADEISDCMSEGVFE